MAQLSLKAMVAKLDSTCRKALEDALGACMSRTHYHVEVEHWFTKLLDVDDSDIVRILGHFGVDRSLVHGVLTDSLDTFKTGNGRPPGFGETVVDLFEQAWLVGSVDFEQSTIRSGFLLIALLGGEKPWQKAYRALPIWSRLSVEKLRKDFHAICAGSVEDVAARKLASEPGPIKSVAGSATPNLDQFAADLTRNAREGRIDPVFGRDDEIRQIIDILMRRRQNNPIIVGEAGVGKTAIVEGLALKIVAGDVPEPLRNVSIRSLDLALLQAGAGVRGEFENRLKGVIAEIASAPQPIILFIDEAHTMIGAGGAAGQGDAANLLKPALARGELRTIAATTWDEYQQHFEKDAALSRRFQVVRCEEPTEKVAVEMLRGLLGTLEKHHGVAILNEAVEDAVRLSTRYISGRQLPDKAVSLLDTTCARIRLSQSTVPPVLDDRRRRLEQLARAEGIFERETVNGAEHSERIEEIREERARLESEIADLEKRWAEEQRFAGKIRRLRGIEPGVGLAKPAADSGDASSAPVADAAPAAAPETAAPSDDDDLPNDLPSLRKRLKELQGENPLVHDCCDGAAIAETVANWTGIPVGRMMGDEFRTLQNLETLLEQSVVGQSHAIAAISRSIRTSRAKLTDPNKPVGVFLLAGTSGVGKTETAISLTELLYGGEQNMTVINMSEFKEEHKVSLLMGPPPGYVGFEQGGVLTEAVRRRPYGVLLLDELEKAHQSMQDVFYQVFDKGHMMDSKGRFIDFKHSVIIMTTNAGTDFIKRACADPTRLPTAEEFAQAVYPELLKTFKPAFLGRVTIIPYYPLSDEIMKRIVRLKLDKIGRRVKENHKAVFRYEEAVVETIASRCTEVDTGARNVDKILNKTVLPELSAECLAMMGTGQELGEVHIRVNEDETFAYELTPRVAAR